MRFKDFYNEATKEDFWELAHLQRDVPEHAMIQVQFAIGGGIMNPVVEHVGDLIHRMSERTTFNYAGYEFVKNKVEKTLRWLTNPYGFRREFEENIASAAKYYKVPEDEYRKKIYAVLEEYAKAHAALPAFNRAQKLAQSAAVSLGKRAFFSTIQALQELDSHLQSMEEWIKFAHEGLQ